MEVVGNVKLNMEYYSGEDLYSDGPVEDELLSIVTDYSASEYDSIIWQKKSWPILYHLSAVRENILNWYPFRKEQTVLEVGAGCGAITGVLADRLKKVTAIELSKKRSMINANRHKESDNIEIMVGNFNDIYDGIEDSYDYVTLIGVLEYAKSYISDMNPADAFLQKIRKLLSSGGKVMIAIENKLGLKYFAGCREDHTGNFFEGIENYVQEPGVMTYSKKELTELLLHNGYGNVQFYYPYPDYKLPQKIFSDTYLPQKGELYHNMRNYDADRLRLFDETRAYDSILEAGLYPEFSNSFLVIAEKMEDEACDK